MIAHFALIFNSAFRSGLYFGYYILPDRTAMKEVMT